MLASLVRRWDPLLVAIVIVFLLFSRIVMQSAAPERLDEQLLHQLLALGVLAVAALLPFSFWMRISPLLYLLGIALLLLVFVAGDAAKGARRWLDFGIIRLQPSELMKFALPLTIASYFHWRRRLLRVWDFGVALILIALPLLLIVKQPDLGTALMVGLAGGVTLFFAGLSWRIIVPLIAAAGALVLLLLMHGDAWCEPQLRWPGLHDYQKARICTLLDPYRDPLGKGFHTIQAEIAIGSGGFWGKGLGQGTQSHLNFIPERHTDFILAVIAEETGLVGGSILFGVFLLLLVRAMRLALRSPFWGGQLYGCAASTILFLYAWVNAAMVTGIAPVVGVPFPFVSYGGTALVSACLMLGVLLSAAAQPHAAAPAR